MPDRSAFRFWFPRCYPPVPCLTGLQRRNNYRFCSGRRPTKNAALREEDKGLICIQQDGRFERETEGLKTLPRCRVSTNANHMCLLRCYFCRAITDTDDRTCEPMAASRYIRLPSYVMPRRLHKRWASLLLNSQFVQKEGKNSCILRFSIKEKKGHTCSGWLLYSLVQDNAYMQTI